MRGRPRPRLAVVVVNKTLLASAKELGARGGEDWRVFCGDCLKLMPQLPDNSADLIFADPPYNLQLKKELYRPNMTRVDGVSESWDKFNSFAEYDSFCESWLRECRRLLSPNGALWVIGTYHNIGRVSRLMQDAGFWILNDVIWHKTNPTPNFRGVRFANATETLLWAKKSENSRYVFNNKLMKSENGGKQMPNVWRLPICNGAERLKDKNGKKLHPTQKPEALLKRVILSSTMPGGVVFDPFLGSGTSLAVARKLGRVGVGIERETTYAQAAAKRIAGVSIPQTPPAEPQPPRRVPFAELLARGMIKPGAKLQASNNNGDRATVCADGKIKVNGASGSIHQIGAKMARAPTCNGWHFWHINIAGKTVPLNDLREQARKLPRHSRAGGNLNKSGH